MIDTHLHLADEKFNADREAVMERALRAGVSHWIEIAESPASWDAAVAMAERYAHVYASVGIHPHHAHEFGPNEWPALCERMRALLRHPKVVAVGEFGLDYFRMRNTRAEQDFIFRRQLEIAREFKKPIIIHCREADRPVENAGEANAHADIQRAVREFYPTTSLKIDCDEPVGVVHCFSGRWEDAQTYFMHGFMLGVDAPVTYPSSKLLQENVRRMPLERIVLETDSPYLPPQAKRGQRNEPSYLPVVAETIAGLKRKTPQEVAERTSANARALFRLPS